jgi:phosphonate transport system permease protein
MAMATATELAVVRETSSQQLARYLCYLIFLTIVCVGYWHLDLPVERLPGGLVEMWNVIGGRMFPPDLEYVHRRLIHPFLETFAMAFIGTVLGIALSVPLAWFASANMTPSPRVLYPIARLILAVARSVHEIIWAMIFVACFGFGPLAGTIVLVINFIGFAGKLLSENVEAADMRPVEAIRAAGGGRLREMVLAIYPQVRPVWFGIFIYGWDIVLRASFILGLVGAGGVGAELSGSLESLRYERVGAILMLIVGIVALTEIASVHLRKRIT